jgi:hypothetical protein
LSWVKVQKGSLQVGFNAHVSAYLPSPIPPVEETKYVCGNTSSPLSLLSLTLTPSISPAFVLTLASLIGLK